MAKNTGRGSRFGGIPSRASKTDTTWIKHNQASGIFADQKARGGQFNRKNIMTNRNVPVSGGAAAAIVGLGCLLVIFSLAVTVAAIWMLVFGIVDLANNGPEFWNIFWIVVGGFILLGNILRTRNNANKKD